MISGSLQSESKNVGMCQLVNMNLSVCTASQEVISSIVSILKENDCKVESLNGMCLNMKTKSLIEL